MPARISFQITKYNIRGITCGIHTSLKQYVEHGMYVRMLFPVVSLKISYTVIITYFLLRL